MTNVDTGIKALAFIIVKDPVASADWKNCTPCLGTTITETGSNTPQRTPEGNTVNQRIVGLTSISLPFDNAPFDITETSTRIVQRQAGAIGISGRIEKWKKNSEWVGACMGNADYSVSLKTTYDEADDLCEYDIIIYTEVPQDTRETISSTTEKSGEVPDAGYYKEKITLKSVKLHSYESSEEPNAGIKETINYSAEEMEIERT